MRTYIGRQSKLIFKNIAFLYLSENINIDARQDFDSKTVHTASSPPRCWMIFMTSPESTSRGKQFLTAQIAAVIPTACPIIDPVVETRADERASWSAEKHLPAIMRFLPSRAISDRSGIW
jgi:hypothetical protein